MIELLGWICLIISLTLMIYHHYMHSNYERVYQFIRKKYGQQTPDIKFPSKEDHAKDAQKFSYYTAFFAVLLIVLNLLSR